MNAIIVKSVLAGVLGLAGWTAYSAAPSTRPAGGQQGVQCPHMGGGTCDPAMHAKCSNRMADCPKAAKGCANFVDKNHDGQCDISGCQKPCARAGATHD